MTSAKHMLGSKPAKIISISPDNTVFEAITVLCDNNLGALLVMENSKMVGIFSERDYARKIILQDRSSRTTKVREVMNAKVLYVTPNTSTDECMALMTEKHIRHLPVLDNENVMGIISIGDCVKTAIDHKSFIIDQLERYITS